MLRIPDLPGEAVSPERRGELRPEHLQGHPTVVLQVSRQIHGGHPAATELPLDVVSLGEDLAHSFDGLGVDGE